MTAESKKLQTTKCQFVETDVCRLMDPARKAPETPLEQEQREVIQVLVDALLAEMAGDRPTHAYSAIAAAAPYILED